jgi:hypothetical protein
MAQASAKSIEVKIRRLERELDEIDKFFYRGNENDDRFLYADMLERKRDDVVRSAVLQLHTSIEEQINSYLTASILEVKKPGQRNQRMRTNAGKALSQMLMGGRSVGFDMKINLAVIVGFINAKTAEKLRELNTIRNRCSHNWMLNVRVRRGKKRVAPKPPLLTFRGKDLHKVQVLKDFCKEFGMIYVKLFLKHLG